jgi:hypothetical protein
VNVFRHHDVSEHHQDVTPAHLFQHFEQKVAPFGSVEQRPSLLTAARDEVQIIGAVVALEAGGHGVILGGRARECLCRLTGFMGENLIPLLAKNARNGAPGGPRFTRPIRERDC